MYFRCSIKISPCITKCLGNFVFKVRELVSKFKQHFSDKPPEGGTVRNVGIYCDCDCNDRYLSVGVEKLKEIETLMEKDSKTFIKTKTELLFGNDRGDDRDLKRELETESRDSKGEEKALQTNIPIGCGIENPIIKVKLDMLVLGKLDETSTEKELVDEKQAQNTESVIVDEKQAQSTKSVTDEELSPPTQDGKQAQNTESITDKDLSPPTQDMIENKENKDPNQGDEQKIRFYNWI